MHADFTGFTDFTPREHQSAAATSLLDDVVAWATALRSVRVAA
jgi:hypothetical protein